MRRARDWDAAQAAAAGFLLSVGAIALIMWSASRWLADFAVYPHVSGPLGSDFMYFPDEQGLKRDYRWHMNEGAFRLVILTAVYWALAFGIGAGRIDVGSAKRSRQPDLWLAFALFLGMGMVFLQAAPRFALGPAIDACVRRYDAAHPDDPCIDCGIHGCEGGIYMAVDLTSLVVIAILMGWSLRLRHRACRKELV